MDPRLYKYWIKLILVYYNTLLFCQLVVFVDFSRLVLSFTKKKKKGRLVLTVFGDCMIFLACSKILCLAIH